MSTFDSRTQSILSHIVDIYLKTRLPVGSRTLSKHMQESWSPATLRNIMADLVERGFLISPHKSAGRLPTGKALCLYIQRLVEEEGIPEKIHHFLIQEITQSQGLVQENLSQALADLCKCAGIVVIPPQDPIIHSLDFIPLSLGKAIAILVTRCGKVEHRSITLPTALQTAQLHEASNYLNARVSGMTFAQAKAFLAQTVDCQKDHLHTLAADLLHKDIRPSPIVKGQAQLLESIQDMEEFQAFKALFAWLEKQTAFQQLLEHVHQAQGIQVFMGNDHPLFNVEGCSFVIAPYGDCEHIGAVGVLGPLHMDYRRIIPIIDFTAKLMERTHVR